MGITKFSGAASAFAAVLSAAIVSGSALAHGPGIFSVRPGHADPSDPATRAYFKLSVPPGGAHLDTVIVTNEGATPVRLFVTPVDGLTGQTSGAVYANRGVPVQKAGTWVSTLASRIVVGPHRQLAVPFRVLVPASATPGDHLAGLAFENAQPTTSSRSHFQITEIIREVVGVLIIVPGPAQSHVRLGAVSLSALPGTSVASVIVGIANSGGLLCKPRLRVSLTGPAGVAVRVNRQLDTILPGDTIAYPLMLTHGLQPGSYAIMAHAACPSNQTTRVATVNVRTHIEGTVDANTRTIVKVVQGGSPATLWLLLAVGGLTACCGILAGVLLTSRSRRLPRNPQ